MSFTHKVMPDGDLKKLIELTPAPKTNPTPELRKELLRLQMLMGHRRGEFIRPKEIEQEVKTDPPQKAGRWQIVLNTMWRAGMIQKYCTTVVHWKYKKPTGIHYWIWGRHG